MRVLFWLRKNKINRSGKAPIYCRLTDDGKRKDFSTEYFVRPEDWNNRTHKVKGDSFINTGLLMLETRLNETMLTEKQNGRIPTAERVITLMLTQQKPVVMLIPWLEKFYKTLDSRTAGTARAERSRHRRLLVWLKFTKREKLSLLDISYLTGRQLENDMLMLGGKPSYIRKVYQYFQQAMQAALLAGHIETNPLAGYSPKPGPTAAITYLTQEEVMKLYAYNFVHAMYRKVVDVFVFQCFTALAHIDTMTFNPELHLVNLGDGGKWIVKNRQKTGQTQTIPLLPLPEKILKDYNNKLPVYSNQAANRIIKEAAAAAGISKHLTCHVGRKTAATYFFNYIPSRSLAAIMGHANTVITEKLYAKLLPETLIKDVAVLFNQP
ncbi:MAG: site-specific integrase [Bacteroidota bacterium]